MANIDIDTQKIREKGSDVMKLAVDINELLVALYERINLVPNSTSEWIGESANEFVRKLNVEKIDYFRMKDILYNYGKFMVKSADEFEREIIPFDNEVS